MGVVAQPFGEKSSTRASHQDPEQQQKIPKGPFRSAHFAPSMGMQSLLQLNSQGQALLRSSTQCLLCISLVSKGEASPQGYLEESPVVGKVAGVKDTDGNTDSTGGCGRTDALLL